jgi:hypothetical protein
MRGGAKMTSNMSHISYRLRRLFRAKGTSIIVILTLALGAGINVAVFSLIQSLLLTSVGVPHPERLIQYTFGSGSDPTFFSGPAYTALQARGIVKDVLAWKVDQFRIQSASGVANITGALVSGNSSQILQIRPFMGSLLSTEQDRPDGGKNGWTAVLGYECWQQHFGGNKNVIGEKIIVDGAPVTIIGVLSEHFKGLMPPISPSDITASALHC